MKLAKKRVLVVEDNPRNMRLLAMTLQSRGYSVLEATDGEQAIEIASKEQPDLIIVDIQLPKMDGLEMTRGIRQMLHRGNIPIIALTAYAMKGDKETFIKAGCDDYLPKPISTRELPVMIDKMLQQRQRGNT